MERLISAIAVILGCALVQAAPPAELTTLRAIHAVTNAEASRHIPVAFEATVTLVRASEQWVFVQNEDVAIFVMTPANPQLAIGDRILVRGTMRPSFRPIVLGESILLLHHGALPDPVPATFGDLMQNRRDCVFVKIRATVHSADPIPGPNSRGAILKLFTDEGAFDAEIENTDPASLDDVLDAKVEVSGVVAGNFDSKMERIGITLHVPEVSGLKVLKRAGNSQWNLPLVPIDEILFGYRVHNVSPRIRVHGTITYYQPATAVVLQDGNKSLWIQTATTEPLRVGDVADATGFPDINEGGLSLTGGEIRDSLMYSPVTPHFANWHSLSYRSNIEFGHIYDLVSIEGLVVTETREATQDVYVLSTEGHLFSAVFRHPNEASQGNSPIMKEIPIGSRIRVTGICLAESTIRTKGDLPFSILLRTMADVVVVARPSLMNVRNLILAVSLLLLAVVAVGAWGWTLRSKVNRQTAALARMAQFEKRRSLIMEKINGTEPLDEILDEVTGLVASMLNGANCWCTLTSGATLGACAFPPEPNALRVAETGITGHKDSTLGTLSVAFDPQLPQPTEATAALTVGARLASLAIDTRRLYTDLRRRSEFDMLTDIPNRFAMEKFMDARIEEARQTAGMLGLIYIDLDKFKQINDQYGHSVGDLFLQEVAVRMKRQLRGADMLARLGGDEFAVLISMVRDRTEVEDIVVRLKNCFKDPFVVAGYILHGSASIGFALYPENGVTKDRLLNAADAAMYVVKNERKQREKSTVAA